MTAHLNSIKILTHNQYKRKALVTFLADLEVLDYHIICLQEPKKSRVSPYCLREAGYHAVHYSTNEYRVTTLVNESLGASKWDSKCPNPDIIIVTIHTNEGDLHVYNVYNFSTQSLTHCLEGTLPLLRQQLLKPGNHIIVDDFNFYHPVWGDHQCLNQHASADILLDIIDNFNLDLALKPGTVTWERHHQTLTLDFVLLSALLTESLIYCVVNVDWQYSSDYRPITTEVMLTILEEENQVCQCWEKANEKEMQQIVTAGLSPIMDLPLTTVEQVDILVDLLIQLIQRAIEAIVPTAQTHVKARSHWNNDCQRVIKEAKRSQCQ